MSADAPLTVYVVEDEPEIQEAIVDISSGLGFTTKGFSSAELFLSAIEAEPCDILVTDLKLPGIDGVELTKRLAEAELDISIIIITAYGNLSSALSAIDHGAEDYILKPFNIESIKHSLNKAAMRKRLLAENAQYQRELESELKRREVEIIAIGQQLEETFFKTVQLLGNAQESRESFLYGRTERITIYAIWTAQQLGWNDQDIVQVAITTPISDVGKISVSDEILNKREPLTEEELAEVRNHVVIGEEIIKSLPHYQDVGTIIRYHHERLDGSGYPEGLSGDAIPKTSLLIGLVDTFDAMTHERPWRDKHSLAETLDYLKAQAGVSFPKDMVDAFMTVFSQQGGDELIDEKPVDTFFDLTFPYLEKLNI